MLGIYFSGTGNTEHCIRTLASAVCEDADVIALEDDKAIEKIRKEDVIYFGYPVQFSNAPYFVREFITSNGDLWKGKKMFCIATMGAFSGDGAGCTARLFRKYGAEILGGVHIKMPDSVCDSGLLKKAAEENRNIVSRADEKMNETAEKIKQGMYPRDGLSLFSHIAGLLGQRLWFYGKTKNYSSGLKISEKCIGCGLCESVCPLKNISVNDGKAEAGDRCTMCYRCISMCPERAITLLGKEVKEQCRFENYM